jgi:uncharacterized protein YfaT (DUF1175 family)
MPVDKRDTWIKIEVSNCSSAVNKKGARKERVESSHSKPLGAWKKRDAREQGGCWQQDKCSGIKRGARNETGEMLANAK